MLLTIVADDLGAGIGLVAKHLIAGFCGESIQQIFRETIRESGQRVSTQQARNLPVADGGVLTGAGFAQTGKAADWLGNRSAAGHAVQIKHAQLGEVITPEIGVPGNGSQGIGTGITKLRGVRLSPDAETIENDQENTFCHRVISLYIGCILHGKSTI